MANFYDKYLLPKLTDIACSSSHLKEQRAKVVPQASGRVLEIGIGTGLNLPFYDTQKVQHLFGLDPSAEMWAIAKKQHHVDHIPVEFIQGSAEQIPLETNELDTIVITYTMCSIPDLETSLSEMRRVLKPGGKLLFCEHGLAPDKGVRRWQNALNPGWKMVSGGCNLNRPIPEFIQHAGFELTELDAFYIPSFKPASFHYLGVARPV